MKLSWTLPLFALLLATGAGSSAASLMVACPEAVPAGEPFLVEIETDSPAENVRILWLDRELKTEWWWERGVSRCALLLGMGLPDRMSDEEPVLEVTVLGPGQERYAQAIRRLDKEYPEQHLEVSERFSELSPEVIERTERESAQIKQAMAADSPERRWHLPFARPVPGEPTSAFGLKRFINGEAKRSHSGLDLKAASGDSVFVCDSGRVILAGDHFYGGNSVYVDHGQGVVSMYFHLSKISVAEGQELKRGDLVGLAGDTGRVTGPHLHFGVSIFGQLVDPRLLL